MGRGDEGEKEGREWELNDENLLNYLSCGLGALE